MLKNDKYEQLKLINNKIKIKNVQEEKHLLYRLLTHLTTFVFQSFLY